MGPSSGTYLTRIWSHQSPRKTLAYLLPCLLQGSGFHIEKVNCHHIPLSLKPILKPL